MKSLLLASCALAALTTGAMAQKAIYSGGVNGAYYKTFCPPLVPALKNAQFNGYQCQTSAGTVENIDQVLKTPTAIGLVQLDVYARTVAEKAEVGTKTVVIRQLACEGVWVVTKNPRIKDYGDVLGLARRLQFVLPPENSGSAATFKFMQTLDADGIGRARNIRYSKDATSVINEVAASTDGAVGLFVQFADPENGNIKLMQEKGLTVIPVVSRELIQAKVGGQDVYQVQTFQLVSGFFAGKEATTACTPVAIITGSPDQFTDRNDRDNQKDMIKEIAGLSEAALLPQEGRLASLMKATKRIGGKALDEMMAAVDAAKKKAEQMNQ